VLVQGSKKCLQEIFALGRQKHRANLRTCSGRTIHGYTGKVSFSATTRGTGRIQVAGTAGGQHVDLFTTYRLQEVQNSRRQDVFADDGNVYLHMAGASLPGPIAYVVVTPGSLPGPFPAGLQLVGDVYDLSASGSSPRLQRPAILTFHYDAAVVGSQAPAGLALYHWDPNNSTWQQVAGALDPSDRAVVAAVRPLGSYALLAPASVPRAYLPIVVSR